MNIGEILSRAWQIIWKHKILWIFGILAGCTGGSSGSSAGSQASYSSNQGTGFIFPDSIRRLFDTPGEVALWVSLGIVVGLALIFLMVFLSTIGRIGLVRGTLQAESGAQKLSFREIFSGSTPYFWRVFGLNLLVTLVGAALLIGMLVLLIFGTVLTLGLLALCLIPCLCLLVPLIWVINIIIQQAVIAIVIDNVGITEGLSRGWDVVREHPGPVLGMGLILLIITVLAGIILAIPVIAILGPLALGLSFFDGASLMTRELILIASGVLLLLPLVLIANGILNAFSSSAWTLTYMRLSRSSKPAIVEVSRTPAPDAEEPSAEV